MAEARPPLALSSSFSGHPSSSNEHALPRPLKRSITDLNFFSTAATSFQPLPYSTAKGALKSRSFEMIPSQRSFETISVPSVSMEPSPKDPNVVFIHPPFTTFPNSHQHINLTYLLMADHLDWFLDANDFINVEGTNQATAVPYPASLEPPRGWCPAKKKDLKDRGTAGWPEGEEPRLRCTFCRRTYAGVNAKSMWRRHVFEKHKIAMANRRDTGERPRGRGSAKENKIPGSGATRLRNQPHDSVISLDVTPQTEPRNVSHKSKFRSGLPSEHTIGPQGRRVRQQSSSKNSASSSESSDGESPSSDMGRDLPLTPPRTPPPSSQSTTDSSPPQATVLQSPYDPTATPSFRHASPRMPSAQPWRYPSPNHPLHWANTMLVETAPSTPRRHGKASPLALASPFRSKSMSGIESPVNRLRKSTNARDADASIEVVDSEWTLSLVPLGDEPWLSTSPIRGPLWESPILRSSPPLIRVSLLEPFSHSPRVSDDTGHSDVRPSVATLDGRETDGTPPHKKRRMTLDNLC